MKLIGIDGGGTKTEAVLFDETGHILSWYRTGPCNPNLSGMEASAYLVKECVETLCGTDGRVDGLYVGTAGIFTADDGPDFSARISRICGIQRVKCENDVMNVIAAATDADRCVAGVCGTGMIVYAKEPARTIRLSGWGYLLGEGGSGYDIGRDAIRAALGDAEGFSRETVLAPLVEKQAGMPLERLVLEVYRRPPAYVGSFAPLAFEADAAGDVVAHDILLRNARAFADVLNYAAKTYDCGDQAVVSGGVATNVRFSELLARELTSGLRLIVPACPQVLGACFNCARFSGIDPSPLRKRLSREYSPTSA
ncbi:MAG: hypothetical protein J6Z49_02240 [Kiritimatiellae bacterium]|nr:hypothetical protein [Kiritimatiellia bacterium]